MNPGDRLGQYEILARLGAGGMGVVYRAQDSKLHRTVALKVLSEERVASDMLELVLQEARAASALNHPNICTIHEVRQEADRIFIVMEYVEGHALHEQIAADGMPADSVVHYGIQIADGLAHAHERGVIHRDVKSANVIITREGRAKLVDFGLAKRFADVSQEQVTRAISSFDGRSTGGTLAYMAPEVLQGEPAGVASDIWSFGVLLFEMSTGHLPFSGRTVFDETAAILRSPLPPLPSTVPAGIRMIVAHCLAKEPEQRYHTARELKAALEAVQSGAAPAVAADRRRVGRSLSPWTAGVAIVIVSIAVGIAAWKRLGRPTLTESGGRLVRVLASDRQASDPALSPDGTMIAYVAEDDDGRIDLFASRVAGGARLRLTNDDSREGRPRFSPDGERIVFARRGPDGSGPDICVVPSLGGEVSVIFRGGAHPSFSPDGARIAFIRYADGGKRLVVATARADGSDLRDLAAGTGGQPFIRAPSWSPDGRLIVFIQGSGGIAGEIWVVNADGSGSPRRLSSDRPQVFTDDPSFAADGRTIIHSSNRGGATNIWALPVNGGAATQLTSGSGPDEAPTTDRQGRIAFINSRWRNELFIHNRRTMQTRSLVQHSPFLWAPAFSPDGQTLAYSRGDVDGTWHLWLTNRAGGSTHQLTNTEAGELYPRWTPDGRSLIFHNWTAPRRVWRIAREGGPPVALTPANIDATFGDISPDGRTLVFAATTKGQEQLFVMPIAGTTPRRLREGPASVPRWSPDGTWIAFSPDRGYFGGVFVVHPDGSGERQVTKNGGWPAWLPDGRIGYVTIRADSTQQIQMINIDAPSRPEPVAIRFSGANFPFDTSRDGEWLTSTTAVHVSSEIWVLAPDSRQQ